MICGYFWMLIRKSRCSAFRHAMTSKLPYSSVTGGYHWKNRISRHLRCSSTVSLFSKHKRIGKEIHIASKIPAYFEKVKNLIHRNSGAEGGGARLGEASKRCRPCPESTLPTSLPSNRNNMRKIMQYQSMNLLDSAKNKPLNY